MSIHGQVWTYVSSINDNNYYIIKDNGRIRNGKFYQYSYLLYCINNGKKMEYFIDEPIPEHGSWRRIA
jgi:hypothetical protein